jgi:hypothetical protein
VRRCYCRRFPSSCHCRECGRALTWSDERIAQVLAAGESHGSKAIIAALRVLQDRSIGSPEACARAIDALIAGLRPAGESDAHERAQAAGVELVPDQVRERVITTGEAVE